jgi:hypothetical protein
MNLTLFTDNRTHATTPQVLERPRKSETKIGNQFYWVKWNFSLISLAGTNYAVSRFFLLDFFWFLVFGSCLSIFRPCFLRNKLINIISVLLKRKTNPIQWLK